MTDRPTIFSAPMIRALLDGMKTQTRRLASSPLSKSKLGDLLWVRERTMVEIVESMPEIGIRYEADGTKAMVPFPSERMKQIPTPGRRLEMGCYREASRLTLEVTGVKVERLQDISEEDAVREGVYCFRNSEEDDRSPREIFADLWRHLHGPESWDQNPFVAAISFTVNKRNIDKVGCQ